MATDKGRLDYFNLFILIFLFIVPLECSTNDILGCGGFVKSHVSLDFSKIEVALYTKEGSLKEKTECAPTNGYYFLPLYEKGEYVLRVHPPAGWSFEPSEIELNIDGVTDECSTGQDINFSFHGFGITGRVITAGQSQGPSGITVQLDDNSGNVRNTVTAAGGDFHFTPVIPGQYTLKASHPKWKLEPSQAIVKVQEGNTALPVGVLAVKGYDVSGSVTSFGSPISGVYILLYSKEDNPKFRIEGCNTALLQGVPDSPICHVKTDEAGEFTFGLVPAGEYWLMALPTAPGQVAVTYNLKPEKVPFTVRHDSLFIKNAFEITGFTVVGTVNASPGKGLAGARVLLDGEPVGKSDATGKFTLPNLLPGVYTVSFEHEEAEVSALEVSVSGAGPAARLAGAARAWRVCGAVTPPARWPLALHGDHGTVSVTTRDNDGTWCTFLRPGVYTAKVEVSEREQRDGLQFYPLNRKISVGHGPVDGVNFSQLKAVVSGRVQCSAAACRDITLTLRHLAGDGKYIGRPLTAVAHDGNYKFESVLPGTVEISAPTNRLCWQEAVQRVTVTEAQSEGPTFVHTGYLVQIVSTHDFEIEAVSPSSREVWSVAAGRGSACALKAERYTLTPRGCHRFQQEKITIDVASDNVQVVKLRAVAHAATVVVTSPVAAADLVLTVTAPARSDTTQPLPYTKEGNVYVYKHTLYLDEGEECSVSAWSSSVLFSPSSAVLRGDESCRAAVTLRARPALTLAGKLVPPVDGVTLTLTGDDVKMSHVTDAKGTYSFGPLDASKSYKITAEKESYVFGEPDENGDIRAHKLAEIVVRLVDQADGSELQGGLVSVSGGQYRRTAQAPGLRFPALQPDRYYVKPHMKEYRFTPQHHLLHVKDGNTHELTIEGERVAWSCLGSVAWASGGAAAGLTLLARPTGDSASQRCNVEEATTDELGAFRIRGLLPECKYALSLKESTSPDLSGLKLLKAPAEIDVSGRRDVSGVRLAAWRGARATDAAVRVRSALPHYRTLRLTLAAAAQPHHLLYNTKVDAAGLSERTNPGVMLTLPRLPADNNTYVLQLESSLSKATHAYSEQTYYFDSDGTFKYFTIEFFPKVKSSEQEMRQTSFLVFPLAALVWVCWRYRAALPALPRARRPVRHDKHDRTDRHDRHDLLDKASIDHILNTVNPPKKSNKKKVQ